MFRLYQDRRYYYFQLVSGNGKVIVQSQAYATKSGAIRGIESVRQWALKAETKDLTK